MSKPHEHCADCLAYLNCVTCCECGEALVPFHPDVEWITKAEAQAAQDWLARIKREGAVIIERQNKPAEVGDTIRILGSI